METHEANLEHRFVSNRDISYGWPESVVLEVYRLNTNILNPPPHPYLFYNSFVHKWKRWKYWTTHVTWTKCHFIINNIYDLFFFSKMVRVGNILRGTRSCFEVMNLILSPQPCREHWCTPMRILPADFTSLSRHSLPLIYQVLFDASWEARQVGEISPSLPNNNRI